MHPGHSDLVSIDTNTTVHTHTHTHTIIHPFIKVIALNGGYKQTQPNQPNIYIYIYTDKHKTINKLMTLVSRIEGNTLVNNQQQQHNHCMHTTS